MKKNNNQKQPSNPWSPNKILYLGGDKEKKNIASTTTQVICTICTILMLTEKLRNMRHT